MTIKRFFSFLLISLISFCAFANVELDFMTTTQISSYQFEGHERYSGDFYPFNIECDVNFFFIPIAGVDLGLNVAGGLDYFLRESTIFGTVAPIVRSTLSEKNSFSLLIGAKHGTAAAVWYNALTASFMYKRWIINADGLHFGLNMGLGFDKLLSGSRSYYSRYEEYDYRSDGGIVYYTDYGYNSHSLVDGFALRLFFGICLNFGDRAFDRNR